MEMLLPLLTVLAVCVGCFLLVRVAKSSLVKLLLSLLGGVLALVFFLLFSLAAFFWDQEPPSLTRLAQKFPERRSTLQQILSMSDQDAHFSRIDPGFVDYGYIDGTPGGQASQGDSDSPLPQSRWNTYRSLFSKAKLDQGFARDSDGNAYFMAGSIGLLNRGHTTGYLFCRDQGSPSSRSSPFEPCTLLHQDSGSQSYGMEPRREAYSFMKVADHWFVFDQGPS